MERFPHLKFSEKLVGRARFSGGGGTHPNTEENKRNRQGHSQGLLGKTSALNSEWMNHISERELLNLAPLDENIEPIFLKINPKQISQSEMITDT